MNRTKLDHEEFTLTRAFNAPRPLVWDAFTKAEHLMRWWGPKEVVMQVANLDLQPGGRFHYCYTMPSGQMMWGIFRYHEILAPERLVYSSAFSDEIGNVVRAPFSPDFPLEVLNTLTFTEQAGTTIVAMRGMPHNATETERNFFAGVFGSIQQGFTGTLNQLEQYLADRQENV